MRDDIELLELMLADQASQPALYRPGPYWAGYQKRAAAAIRRHGLARFRATPSIGKGYADCPVPTPAEAWAEGGAAGRVKLALSRLPKLGSMFADYELALRRARAELADCRSAHLEATCRDLPVERLPDTLHGGAVEKARIRDRDYAPIYLGFLARIEAFRPQVDFAAMRSVFEIGGGFGGWLHALLALQPNVRKAVYLDIPPMIYVGTQYLRHFYGDAVKDYRATRGRQTISFANDDELEILCLCPWQIERLRQPVDLFWNAASLSEMPKEIVDNYARRIEARTICLMMNKSGKVAGTSSPEEVTGAFGRDFSTFRPQPGGLLHALATEPAATPAMSSRPSPR